MNFQEQIKENNKTHKIDKEELNQLIQEANKVYKNNFNEEVHFERSVFINWTCAIADCKYCYLSTREKLAKNALRSPASILAEIFVCKKLGFDIGYITGGLRVESTEYLIELMKKINLILDEKVKMNFGPYNEQEILAFKPYISGMGCAIESFDEELHNYICPSKPLKSLMRTLKILKEQNINKFITIILGMGEKKSDVNDLIEKIEEYNIETVQLCFLKPIKNTVFETTPPPDPKYMAYWIARLRIAHPKLKIKIALVKECMDEFNLLLKAGANGFSRYMMFKDTKLGKTLKEQCEKANRILVGNFTDLPEINFDEIDNFKLSEKETIKQKAIEYYAKLSMK